MDSFQLQKKQPMAKGDAVVCHTALPVGEDERGTGNGHFS